MGRMHSFRYSPSNKGRRDVSQDPINAVEKVSRRFLNDTSVQFRTCASEKPMLLAQDQNLLSVEKSNEWTTLESNWQIRIFYGRGFSNKLEYE